MTHMAPKFKESKSLWIKSFHPVGLLLMHLSLPLIASSSFV